jgi:hypothetical protein
VAILVMVILVMTIVVILLMAIGDYSSNGYCGYSINGYWWLF